MLTAENRAIIQRLRRAEKNWGWARWIPLGWSAFAIAFPVYYYFDVIHRLRKAIPPDHQEPISQFDLFLTGSYTFLACVLFILFFAGLFVAGWVLGHWRGHPRRKLLLALADTVLRDNPPERAT